MQRWPGEVFRYIAMDTGSVMLYRVNTVLLEDTAGSALGMSNLTIFVYSHCIGTCLLTILLFRQGANTVNLLIVGS